MTGITCNSLSHRDREPEPHANNPPLYDGDPNSCLPFLSQCSLVFALQPRQYATEQLKVAYVITLLTGRACEWGTAVWDAGAFFCTDFEEFRCEMTRLFDRSVKGDEAASKLAQLHQGGHSVTEYAIQFKTLAASFDWNGGGGALRAMFFGRGLTSKSRTRLLPTIYPWTWRALSIWPLESKAASACVSVAWLPARPGGWRKPSLLRTTHHLNRPWLNLSPCKWGDFDCLLKRNNKSWFGVSASTVESRATLLNLVL